jgi:hypothetical protein
MIRRPRLNPRGFALPAVMLFLLFAFGAWAVFFRSSGSIIRVEQARVLRESRSQWSAPAGATALRLLQTGNPPSDPYSCKVTLTQDAETRYLLLTFEKVGPARWNFVVAPTDADDASPDAPATFFTVPEPPGGMDATAVSTSRIDVSWADVSFDDGYLIERSPNGTTGWTQIGTTAKNVTTYASTGLASNTTYYYRVRGTNAAGNGSYSSVVSATTFNVIPADPT